MSGLTLSEPYQKPSYSLIGKDTFENLFSAYLKQLVQSLKAIRNTHQRNLANETDWALFT